MHALAGEVEVFAAGGVLPVLQLQPRVGDGLPRARREQLEAELEKVGVDEPVRSVLDRKLLVVSVKLPDFVGWLGHGGHHGEGLALDVECDVVRRAAEWHLHDKYICILSRIRHNACGK